MEVEKSKNRENERERRNFPKREDFAAFAPLRWTHPQCSTGDQGWDDAAEPVRNASGGFLAKGVSPILKGTWQCSEEKVPAKAFRLEGKDFRGPRKDFQALGKPFNPMGKAFDVMGKAFRAMGKASHASGKAFPASGRAFQPMGKVFPLRGKAFRVMEKSRLTPPGIRNDCFEFRQPPSQLCKSGSAVVVCPELGRAGRAATMRNRKEFKQPLVFKNRLIF